MKKILTYSLLTLLLSACLWIGLPAQVTNPLTRGVLQAANFTLSGIWTFAKPIVFTSSTVSAPSTGIKFDADTNSLDSYKSGLLGEQVRGNEWIPPDCVDSDGPRTFGAFCKDASTGRVLVRTAQGVKAL